MAAKDTIDPGSIRSAIRVVLYMSTEPLRPSAIAKQITPTPEYTDRPPKDWSLKVMNECARFAKRGEFKKTMIGKFPHYSIEKE